jgi:uncharacterized protein (TIGR00251 family)
MSDQRTRINVYVQPRASKTEVAGLHGEAIKIRLAAPPVDNAANVELIDFLARHLGIAKRQIRIVAGLTGRRKILEFDGISADALARALS